MALANDLLLQATQLASIDTGKPKQANLRRAVSAAYYALFHLLIDDGAASAGSKVSAAAKARIRRAFAHADMKTVCSQYAKASAAGSMNAQIAPLLTWPLASDLKNVAETFVTLQEARHQADYDLSTKFSRIDVVGYIDITEIAFADWTTAKTTANAKIFLMDLLLRKTWSRT